MAIHLYEMAFEYRYDCKYHSANFFLKKFAFNHYEFNEWQFIFMKSSLNINMIVIVNVKFFLAKLGENLHLTFMNLLMDHINVRTQLFQLVNLV